LGKEYRNWTKEDLEGVIFSDECIVQKSKDPKGIWMFRTLEEKWHKDCIHGVTKGPGIKVMVWACIWDRNKDPLISIFEKSVNKFVYIGVLENGLVDVWQEVKDTVGILSSAGWYKDIYCRTYYSLICRKQHTGYGRATYFPRPQSY